MKSGFVALLDVLGFSALVSNDNEGTRINEYYRKIQEVFIDDEESGTNLEYVVFSDSIVITTESTTDKDFRAIVSRCSKALGTMLENGIALRGAISCGSFHRFVHDSGVFLAGKSIVDAYQFEIVQDWVGIMLTPTVVKQFSKLVRQCVLPERRFKTMAELVAIVEDETRASFYLQPCDRIPFRDKGTGIISDYSGYAILPSYNTRGIGGVIKGIDRSLSSLDSLKSFAPNPSAQAKYVRTQQWLAQLRNN